MTARAILVPQVEHRLRGVSEATLGLEWDQARFELAPGRPSIAWILGHLVAGVASVAEAVLEDDPRLPEGFSEGHRHAHWGLGEAAGWRGLRDEWMRIAGQILEGLGKMPERDWAAPPAIPILPEFASRLTTRQAFLEGEIFHLAYHLGQIGTLRAAQGLGWPST